MRVVFFLGVVALSLALGTATKKFNCGTLVPEGKTLEQKQTSEPPYALDIGGRSNNEVEVRLTKLTSQVITSFIIQCRNTNSDTAVGTWLTTSTARYVHFSIEECVNSVTSSTLDPKPRVVQATWVIPAVLTSSTECVATVVTPDDKYWTFTSAIRDFRPETSTGKTSPKPTSSTTRSSTTTSQAPPSTTTIGTTTTTKQAPSSTTTTTQAPPSTTKQAPPSTTTTTQAPPTTTTTTEPTPSPHSAGGEDAGEQPHHYSAAEWVERQKKDDPELSGSPQNDGEEERPQMTPDENPNAGEALAAAQTKESVEHDKEGERLDAEKNQPSSTQHPTEGEVKQSHIDPREEEERKPNFDDEEEEPNHGEEVDMDKDTGEDPNEAEALDSNRTQESQRRDREGEELDRQEEADKPKEEDKNKPENEINNDVHDAEYEARIYNEHLVEMQKAIDDENRYSEGTWRQKELEEERKHQEQMHWEEMDFERREKEELDREEARMDEERRDKIKSELERQRQADSQKLEKVATKTTTTEAPKPTDIIKHDNEVNVDKQNNAITDDCPTCGASVVSVTVSVTIVTMLLALMATIF